jgi:hypothetical protein
VLQIAPPLYGKSRDDLDDEDTRQCRVARRIAVIGILALVALLVTVTITDRVSREQQSVADCRQLAGQASCSNVLANRQPARILHEAADGSGFFLAMSFSGACGGT